MAIGPVETVDDAPGATGFQAFSPAFPPRPYPAVPGCGLRGWTPNAPEPIKLSLRLSGMAAGAAGPMTTLSTIAQGGFPPAGRDVG